MNTTPTGFDAPLDLRAGRPGEWIVLNAIHYTPSTDSPIHPSNVITIPAGFVTDLASIPRLLRPLMDQNDASRAPAVLHDYLYCSHTLLRVQADLLFLEALQRAGISRLRRCAMYVAVRIFGSRYWSARPAGLVLGSDIVDLGAD